MTCESGVVHSRPNDGADKTTFPRKTRGGTTRRICVAMRRRCATMKMALQRVTTSQNEIFGLRWCFDYDV